MIRIQGYDGNLYEYNESNQLISVNGEIVSSANYEPVFINSSNPETPPIFSGILIKKEQKVVGRSGSINALSDPGIIGV